MKIKTLLLGLAMIFTVGAAGVQAQKKDVTKFMGIPVDGTKTAMIQKLKAKGFTYNAKLDRLEGEFNGRDSYIMFVTNKDKVWRIAVVNKNPMSASEAKDRFNTLCWQFENNRKYLPMKYVLLPNLKIYIGPDDFQINTNEDLSYEMTVNKKKYKASYYQLSDIVINKSETLWTKKNNYEITLKEYQDSLCGLIQTYYDDNNNKRFVWLDIQEQFGEYYILIFYDNENNESNGEDL